MGVSLFSLACWTGCREHRHAELWRLRASVALSYVSLVGQAGGRCAQASKTCGGQPSVPPRQAHLMRMRMRPGRPRPGRTLPVPNPSAPRPPHRHRHHSTHSHQQSRPLTPPTTHPPHPPHPTHPTHTSPAIPPLFPPRRSGDGPHQELPAPHGGVLRGAPQGAVHPAARAGGWVFFFIFSIHISDQQR